MEKKEFQFKGVKVVVHKPNDNYEHIKEALKEFYLKTTNKKEK